MIFILFCRDDFPAISVGDVIEIYNPDPEFDNYRPRLLLKVKNMTRERQRQIQRQRQRDSERDRDRQRDRQTVIRTKIETDNSTHVKEKEIVRDVQR
jgi:hypothetical protein